MSAILPDGYFYKDHLVWDDPSRGAVVGRGMDVSFGDHSAADAPQFLNLQDSIMKALGALHESERLQLHFYTTTRYEEDLERFERQSGFYPPSPRVKTVSDAVEKYILMEEKWQR